MPLESVPLLDCLLEVTGYGMSLSSELTDVSIQPLEFRL
jgi:hypothetical protein